MTINGQLTLKFVVDSGASDVSVPADVVMTLLRTETITEADFLGKQTYTLADGSTLPSQQFTIRSLKVGDRILENVIGSRICPFPACSRPLHAAAAMRSGGALKIAVSG